MQPSGAVLFMLSGFVLSSLRAVVALQLRYPPNRIAVVGAGIGGTSAAYFLREKFGKDVHIDVYEKEEVGGRLATIEMEGKVYEAGGSVIHPLNLHMKTFVKELGLNARTPSGDLLGIYNGDYFVFQESEWSIINLIKMLWNYGLNFLRMHMWVEDILDRFMRIYRYQTFDYSFSTTEALLHAMGGSDFIGKLNMTIDEALQKSGFSQRFIDDIVVPAMRVNYCQGVHINGFVGAVSLAGTSSGLWAVEGGNNLICKGLLYASNAKLIQGTVTSVQEKVRPTKSGNTARRYEVTYASDKGPGSDMYDIVVIATPLNKEIGNIDFPGFNPPIQAFSRPYQQTVATFVHGRVNSSFFGFPNTSPFPLAAVLTTDSHKLFFRSISSLSPATSGSEFGASKTSDLRTWKIFSPEVLRDEELHQLFVSYSAVNVKKWLAYPKYNPPEKMPPIILHRGIYYLNSIEWAASAMEMSAISAKNVALLSYHQWYEKEDQIDQEDLVERLKSEL
ncbi:prenylcysteine oxidase 1-like [Hyperolius riggenbachi]|uniref:prenylcysteine oxidase 1-like n=1 Tax=Hyperolius riggenbachi TaxID=752182 RepID=UPI0035A32390